MSKIKRKYLDFDVYTQSEVTTISGDIVVQIPSLSGYATEAYVTTVSGDIVSQIVASGIATDTAGFDGLLAVTDDTVQKALDTLDDINHHDLPGLADDDHTQYILADGTRAFTGIYEAVGMVLTEGDVQIQSVLASDGDTSGLTTSGTTNGTVGQALYVNDSGDWALAKADAEGTMPVAAIAVDSDTALTYGCIRNDAWDWTPGGLIYASTATAGALTQDVPTASGSQVQVVGIAISADIVLFNPDYTAIELGDSPFYTKEELTTSGVLDVRYYTEDEVDVLIASASGTMDHSALNNLDYASSGHTGFASSSMLTTTSGDIVAQIPTDFYTKAEITTISGDITAQMPTDYISESDMTTISGDIVAQIPDTSEFLMAVEITTISGDIIAQIPTDFYTQAEITTISGNIVDQIPIDYVSDSEMTTISGDIVAQIPTNSIIVPTTIADEQWFGTAQYGKAGHDYSIGNLLYCKYHGAEWLWYKYDSNGADKEILPIGIAIATTTSGNNGVILTDGRMRLDSWGFSPSEDYSVTVYAGDTPGELTLTVASGVGEMGIIVGMLIGDNVIKTHFGYWYIERI